MTSAEIFRPRGMHGQFPSIADRLDVSGDCWIWNGYKDKVGYGHLGTRDGVYLVHRHVWELLVGPITDDLVLDHLCLVKACVNPDHLEPVTQAENNRRNKNAIGPKRRREKVCANGHEFSGKNLSMSVTGQRVCKACSREKTRRFRERTTK